jgi:hypothetical protein
MSALTFFAGLGKAVGLEPLAKEISGRVVQRMVGFWVMWHLAGGLDGLIKTGWLSRTAVYRSRVEFTEIMKVDVEAFWPEAIAFIDSERKRLAA